MYFAGKRAQEKYIAETKFLRYVVGYILKDQITNTIIINELIY
jgi:hypothetical protein